MNAIYTTLMGSALTSPLAIYGLLLFIATGVAMLVCIAKGKGWLQATSITACITFALVVYAFTGLLRTTINAQKASAILQTKDWEIMEAKERNGVMAVTILRPDTSAHKVEGILGKATKVNVVQTRLTATLSARDIQALSNTKIARLQTLETIIARNL